MWKKKKTQKREEYIKQEESRAEENLQELFFAMKKSSDFKTYKVGSSNYQISYINTLIDHQLLNHSILPILKSNKLFTLEEAKDYIPVQQLSITDDVKEIRRKIMTGHIVVQTDESNEQVLVIFAGRTEGRDVSIPEVEFSVVGPKEAFVESIDQNTRLIRKRLPLPQLTLKELKVGKMTQTRIGIIFLEEIASQENVDTVIQRIEDIQYDQIIDSSFITQIISDNSHSPFPQLLDTERPDRVVEGLVEGKIGIIVDGSPHVLTCPTTIVEFFSASDDYFLPWHLATVFRLIRLFAVLFSVLSTPLYVAILTYHHEMIPEELMTTIVASRADIPFPPILEVIILEIAIELLREAGARLPTKIGQTIGIVGGIVIGTAAVDAGLTSNVLLIIVALAALASFTTPVYQIGNTIRLIRFPFLLGAQLWGLVGIAMVMAFYIGHLIKLKSIGRPFFAPIYPLRFRDLRDAFIRLPFSRQSERPVQTRPQKFKRFNQSQSVEKRDIDE
ncbi:spore germination protein [Halobacillus sp. Marseille-Q1614]|uniref:spore germination protein n=1 Tax=Halobacillus sp. Marseille-Q1614 TaxID=2709134 RepID=UPI0015700E71|nr:spore germination protein [Halobacillus sp. Marseille-Q1614]